MASERFEMAKRDTTSTFGTQLQIIVDKETGVQYLFAKDGYGAGLTVLVDKEGRPLLADGYSTKL